MLLILIDGLPFWKLSSEQTPFLQACGPARLTPGLGFSVNLYPELLAGQRPDDLGFFNKWMPDEPLEDPGALTRFLLRTGDLSRISFPLSRVIHKIFEKTGITGTIGNVPFELLPYFVSSPKEEIFKTRKYETIFLYGQWNQISASNESVRVGQRDDAVFHKAKKLIENEDNLFVLFADLDATAHKSGVGRHFDDHLATLDRYCAELAERFIERHGEKGEVVLFSDHGMASVPSDGGLKFPARERLGPPGAETYLYMLESVMIRFWFYDQKLVGAAEELLHSTGAGSVLSEQERAKFGITNPDFGHKIFLLDEGRILYPSFFGGRYPYAMHGYHPHNESQQGVVASPTTDSQYPSRSIEMFQFLKTVAARDQGPSTNRGEEGTAN